MNRFVSRFDSRLTSTRDCSSLVCKQMFGRGVIFSMVAVIILLLAVYFRTSGNLFSSTSGQPDSELSLSTKNDHQLAAQIGHEKEFTDKMKNTFQEMNTASRVKDLKKLKKITDKVRHRHTSLCNDPSWHMALG